MAEIIRQLNKEVNEPKGQQTSFEAEENKKSLMKKQEDGIKEL